MDPNQDRVRCQSCYKLIEEVEEVLFQKGDIAGALLKFRTFFLTIGWNDDPSVDDANRSSYSKLIDCPIPESLRITPKRRRELEIFAGSIHSLPTITCSVYIENTLGFILKNSRDNDLEECIKLILNIPLKEEYLDFMAYAESPNSTVMSGPRAMNAFRSFMSLATALIMKKIDIPILTEERVMPLIDITSLLSSMYGCIQRLFTKIHTEGGCDGIDIQIVNGWYDKCDELYKMYLQNIRGEMNRCRDTLKQLETRHSVLTSASAVDASSMVSAIRQLEQVEIPQINATFEELIVKRLRLHRETKPLVDQIEESNFLSESRSRPNTPPRAGGNKRVKKNNSKSKKYKKNNSKSKKYKKNNSKSKKYKKNNSKSKKYKII
jgi:hypothetical protein